MARSTDEGVRRLRGRGLGTAAAVALACAAPAGAHAAITVPDDFAVTRVAEVTIPTALAFGPQDQLLVATKAGRVLSLARGADEPRQILDLRPKVCRAGERGHEMERVLEEEPEGPLRARLVRGEQSRRHREQCEHEQRQRDPAIGTTLERRRGRSGGDCRLAHPPIQPQALRSSN